MRPLLKIEDDHYYGSKPREEGLEMVQAGTHVGATQKKCANKIDAVATEPMLLVIFGLDLMEEIIAQNRNLPLIINNPPPFARISRKCK